MECLNSSTVGWIEAWTIWWRGCQVANSTMYGHPIYVWARIGKILSLIAGSVIVADILGEDRMKRYAESGEQWAEKSLRSVARYSWRATLVPYHAATYPFRGGWIRFVLSALVAFVVLILALALTSPLFLVSPLLAIFFATGLLIGPVYLLFFYLFVIFNLYCFANYLTLAACLFSAIMGRSKRFLQILSLILLVMGFALDFLAS